MKLELKDVLVIGSLLVTMAFGYGDLRSDVSTLERDNEERRDQAVDLALLKQEMGQINRQLAEIKEILKAPPREGAYK